VGTTAVAIAVLWLTAPRAQSDLDALMERVLDRREAGWRTLQQYVLDERETFALTGPGGRPLYGFRRDYLWFPRDGRFIRSPIAADGVPLGEDARRREEQRWVEREDRRAKRRAEAGADTNSARGEVTIGPNGIDAGFEAAMRDALEPGFVSAAYFLNFKFDPGQYALVGREAYRDRAVLRIEYYPTKLFTEGRTRPNRELRERDAEVERRMNKVSLVTLWVDPAQHQIVRYEFANIDTDFLPAQWFLRLDRITATMEMGQPFPNVWLPESVRIGFGMTTASGEIDGRYASEYQGYRLAEVETKIR
jgi:hypothetical protein